MTRKMKSERREIDLMRSRFKIRKQRLRMLLASGTRRDKSSKMICERPTLGRCKANRLRWKIERGN